MRAGIKRWGSDQGRVMPAPSGQPGQALIDPQNYFGEVAGSRMSPWWVRNMTTQKHESEGNELLAMFSRAQFKLGDACHWVFRGLMRLAPLKNLLGARKIDVFNAIYSLCLSSTTSTLIIPWHSNYSVITFFNTSAYRSLRDPMRNVQKSLYKLCLFLAHWYLNWKKF